MKPVVYISGPMTGFTDLNFPAFNKAAAEMRERGYEVVNPVDINPDPDTPWTECMRNDIKALLACTHIALLPGWQRSKGARIEAGIAFDLGMELIYVQDVA